MTMSTIGQVAQSIARAGERTYTHADFVAKFDVDGRLWGPGQIAEALARLGFIINNADISTPGADVIISRKETK